MKSIAAFLLIFREMVTPFAGVWIEILFIEPLKLPPVVTPFAGVWIEILFIEPLILPPVVTPFAGVWIEIFSGINQ